MKLKSQYSQPTNIATGKKLDTKTSEETAERQGGFQGVKKMSKGFKMEKGCKEKF